MLSDAEPFEDIELKHPIVNARFAAHHCARFTRNPKLFRPCSSRYLEQGLKISEYMYHQGLEKRTELPTPVGRHQSGLDAIVCPTSLALPKPVGERYQRKGRCERDHSVQHRAPVNDHDPERTRKRLTGQAPYRNTERIRCVLADDRPRSATSHQSPHEPAPFSLSIQSKEDGRNKVGPRIA